MIQQLSNVPVMVVNKGDAVEINNTYTTVINVIARFHKKSILITFTLEVIFALRINMV